MPVSGLVPKVKIVFSLVREPKRGVGGTPTSRIVQVLFYDRAKDPTWRHFLKDVCFSDFKEIWVHMASPRASHWVPFSSKKGVRKQVRKKCDFQVRPGWNCTGTVAGPAHPRFPCGKRLVRLFGHGDLPRHCAVLKDWRGVSSAPRACSATGPPHHAKRGDQLQKLPS